MPDAFERLLVLAWFQSNVSRAQKHSSACVCQVISGNVIMFCLLIARLVLPPNRRLVRNPPLEWFLWWGVTAHRDGWLQLTPLRGREIVRILKTDFRSIVISIYRCGATEAQGVGPYK